MPRHWSPIPHVCRRSVLEESSPSGSIQNGNVPGCARLGLLAEALFGVVITVSVSKWRVVRLDGRAPQPSAGVVREGLQLAVIRFDLTAPYG